MTAPSGEWNSGWEGGERFSLWTSTQSTVRPSVTTHKGG